jgi:hypothetical protein
MTTAWQHVDTHQLLTASDQQTIADANDASHQLNALLRGAPALLAAIRDSMAGQPQAARPDASRSSAGAWCWTHQCELTRCVDDARYGCDAGTIDRPNDPAGEAAITNDRATNHRNEIIRRLRRITTDVRELHALAALYPADPFEPETAHGPGGDWCRSCWRDGQYHQPIDRDKDGQPYYAGLCRWCGSFNARERFLPPVDLLAHRHRGERVTEGMVLDARRAHRLQAKKTKKTKTKKR